MTTTATPQLRRAGRLAFLAAAWTFALIVFGGMVRITGSGMGCGEHWPKCNGEWIPTFTLETFIEYMHRLLAVSIGTVVLIVFAYALLQRARPGVSGRGGLLRPLSAAMVLLVVQALLGAITVRLGLSRDVTALHFMTAQIFLATLLVTAVRAGSFGARHSAGSVDGPRDASAARQSARIALVSASFGFIVIAFGALTANTTGAPQACGGFPLCNGRMLPFPSAATTQLHWAHRMLAFAFFLQLLGAVIAAVRRGAARGVTRAAATALALVTAQLGVAAAMILTALPRSLQALHLGFGAAIWVVLVVWTALARRDAAALEPAAAAAPAAEPVAALG